MSDSNLTATWRLSSGTRPLPAASIGVTEIVRRRTATDGESCLLRMGGGAFDAAPRFPVGAAVSIQRGGVPWFVGRVTGTPGTGEGGAEEIGYQLSGPWWYLEQLVYQQEWTLQGGQKTGLLGRLILGQAADGSRRDSGQIVTDVLQYAIDAGAPFQIGVVEPHAILPLEEVRDVTCAQVIRRVLRWHPDCVAWFDHGTAPMPTFYCRQRANLPAVTFTVGQAPLAAVRGVTARADLLTPAVVLHYETSTDGEIDVLTDAAPAGATGREFGALVATIPVQTAAGGEEENNPGFAGASELPVRGADGTSLAQALYAARNVLQYSGSVELVEREAGGTGAGVGTTLNLAGTARAEWATMRAPVVEEETTVSSGATTLRFGPVVGAESLAEALRITQPGVEGREPGSPAAVGTNGSAARTSGRR